MTNKLNVYRSGVIVTSFDIDESTVFNEKLNGTKTITCAVNSIIALDLQKEDYIIYKDEKFTINVNPEAAKEGTSLTKSYNMVFEPDQATMLDIFVDKNGVKTFPYYGTAAGHLQLLTDSMGAGWSVSEVDSTEEKNLDYDWTYVRSALDQIAAAFELECQVTGKSIKMVKSIGRDTGLLFRYGRGKGLHQIKRAADTSKSSVNRVYGIGGTKNIPATYRGGVQTNLVFEERFIETAGVTAGTVRIKEVKYVNEDIYPHFLGTVTSTTVNRNTAGEVTSCTITDSAIDFNINEHFQAGVKAKVSFLTGPLTGVDFEISAYNAITKTTTLINNTDANGYILPNNLNYPGIGDKFTYLEMNMPEEYVIRAENDLKAKTQQYLYESTPDRSIFDVKPDEKHLRDNQIYLQVGDRAKISDTELQADEILRFTEISYPLVNEFNVTGVVGNEVKYDVVEKLFANVLQAQQQIQVINRTNIENARRNSRNLIELRDAVVDPDGNYYTELIKPRSIESLYLSVGAVATNFNLNNISFNPNVAGNPNAFTATSGQLIHYDIKLGENGYIWEMQPYSVTNLVAANKYFLYAKISKTTLVGSWELSTEVKLVESLPGFYILQAGVLFSVKDGRRDNQLTKGMVFIVGDQITAGRMKSIDGKMFIDLTTGQLNLIGAKSAFDFNVSRPGEVTLAGAFFQSGSGVISPIPAYRGVYVPGASYFKGDTVTYAGSSWIYINELPGSGHVPADDVYWDVLAAEGSKGDGLQTQYSVNGSSLWHDTFTVGDIYMRQRSGDAGTWSTAIRIVGEGGDPGVDGKYTDYQFAKNPSLTISPTSGWQDSPVAISDTEYLWMRTGEFNADGSQIGAWSTGVRISGKNGSNGINGDNGINGNYTEFVFQKNGSTTVAPTLTQTDSNPSGWSVVQPSTSAGEYLWMSSALKSGTTGALINVWATPVRTNSKDGDPGAAGSPGSVGPSLSYTGNYDPARTYTGSSLRIEAVKYSGIYYFTTVNAGSFSGVLPNTPETLKWNAVGAIFDSVATDLLLAKAITVDDLTVRNVKTAEAGTKHVEINGIDNNIKIIDASSNELIVIDDDSAVEYMTISAGDGSHPILVNHYGPGIKIGTPGGRTGSYGRRAIILIDDSGMEQFFIGTDTNSRGRVALDIYNGLHLKNADGGIKQTIAGVDYNGVTGNFLVSNAFGNTAQMTFKNGILTGTINL